MSSEKRALEPDVWRDTSLRYMGYANEIGEAFRPLAPKFVRPSYCVAFGYVIGDTSSKYNEYNDLLGDTGSSTLQRRRVFAGVDCLAWQTLASVVLPGAVINGVTKASVAALASQQMTSLLHPKVVRYGPTGIGLLAIPFIIAPIDRGVDALMDATLRKWY
jgi:mitochondrial fission process protein 1